ncbi:S-layer homology domain-containing protein [Paenibacillus sp. EPM92]|uniref:S-layer homology domain-containing protein n=1 Tax=Paenibacillus sp. EPM92 TaxID=1561195 RepID=UPI001915F131|nr:S-layer homology domain-containing protein [Paenibacillus sp. EPM92]
MVIKKTLVATLSVSLVYGSLLCGPVPLADRLQGEVYAATVPFPNKQLLDEINLLRSIMTSEELQAIKEARERMVAMRSDLSGNRDLVKPVWGKIETRKGQSESYPEVTQENVLHLVLELAFYYDQQGRGLNTVITSEKNRQIVDQLIKLGGFPGGINDVTLNDVNLIISKIKMNIINRYRSMTLSQLLRLASDPDQVYSMIEEDLQRIVNDPGLKISKLLNNLGITGKDLSDTVRLFIPEVDSERKAVLAWASVISRAWGLGQGGSGGDSGGGGVPTPSPGAPSPETPATPPSDFTGNLEGDALSISRETEGGRTLTKAIVDSGRLTEAFEAIASGEAGGNEIKIDLTKAEFPLQIELPAPPLKDAAQSEAVVRLAGNGVSYAVPAAIFARLNSANQKVVITISDVVGTARNQVHQAVQQTKANLLLPEPFDFSIRVENTNGTRSPFSDYSGIYVERTVTLPGQVNSDRSTAVSYDPVTGRLNFAPSTFTSLSDEQTQVNIRSPHDTVYTVISSEKTFKDISGHWAKKEIETLASKLIVDGTDAELYSPDTPLTRAQFTALLVRSLGIKEAGYSSRFTDVSTSDWHSGSVEAAVSAGLIEGYEDGTFRPDEPIQREQLAVMIARASRFAGRTLPATTIAEGKWDQLEDRSGVSLWAVQSVKQSLQADLLEGVQDKRFEPKEKATRAQAAVILKRLLTYLKFID